MMATAMVDGPCVGWESEAHPTFREIDNLGLIVLKH